MITWKMMERLCTTRMKWEEKQGRGWIKRAGVTGSQLIGRPELNKDRVDFHGEALGVKFATDVKTCSYASFNLNEVFFKRGQYDELVTFKGVAFILLHFHARQLEKGTSDAATFAFPVRPEMEFWKRYESGEQKSISRDHCREMAVPVRWEKVGKFKDELPDIVSAVQELADKQARTMSVQPG